MANLIVVSVLLGAILGRFFKVWVLIPATAAMVLLVMCSFLFSIIPGLDWPASNARSFGWFCKSALRQTCFFASFLA